jgi:serine protease
MHKRSRILAVYGLCVAGACFSILPVRKIAAQENAPVAVAVAVAERDEAKLRAFMEDLPYVPGDVIVKFRAGTDAQSRSAALSVLRADPSAPAPIFIGDALLVHSAAEPNAEAAAAALRLQPEVEWVQPNYIRHTHSLPNDPNFREQWNFQLMNLPKAWDINPGGNSNVIAAVIDSGAAASGGSASVRLWTGSGFGTLTLQFQLNPDISPGRILPGRDYFAPIVFGGTVRDLEGHGTHVAATILEEANNGLAYAGVAYKATLLPLKACGGYWDFVFLRGALGQSGFISPDTGGCADADVAAAIQYAADAGAQVINLSLGGPRESPIQLDALRYAVQHGSFVAISAGNDFEDGNPVVYPAAYAPQIDGVMAVGAIGPSRRRAFYSNTGSYVEIAAPGGNDREGGASAVIFQYGLCVTDNNRPWPVVPRFDRYCLIGGEGTSMAAPHVAGVAALLYSQGVKNPAAIEAAIKRFAHDLGMPGRDDEYGAGLIDARATLLGLGVAP